MLRTIAARSLLRPTLARSAAPAFARAAHTNAEESFEAFSERYVNFFKNAEDVFELQRGLNNCFAHDLVPSPAVVEAAVQAARRVNDYATAVRVFEGVKEKVENKGQYYEYLKELAPLRQELGMSTHRPRGTRSLMRAQVSRRRMSSTLHRHRGLSGRALCSVRIAASLSVCALTAAQ